MIGCDCLHDLAVLKIDATSMPTVKLGNSADLALGQRVVALGYALALEGGPTVTSGIVSSLDRTIKVQDPGCADVRPDARTYTDVIQTDAAINHGNSGGPLVNMQGQVVGINTAGDDNAQNIGFAIAIDSVKQTIANAEHNPLGVSAYLGAITEPVTSDLAFQLGLTVKQGAYVVDTPNDGPAPGRAAFSTATSSWASTDRRSPPPTTSAGSWTVSRPARRSRSRSWAPTAATGRSM